MRFFWAVWIGVWMVPGAYADDFFSPPQIAPQPPPWIQDAQQDGDSNDQNPNNNPNPNAPPPGFWGDEDPEEEEPSFRMRPSSPRSSNEKPKDNFQLTEPWNDVFGDDEIQRSCLGWGHPFLGVMLYQDHDSCNFVLSQTIETSKHNVRSLEDHTRSMILREVIKGNLTRDEAKSFEFRYEILMDVLMQANLEGCRCLQ